MAEIYQRLRALAAHSATRFVIVGGISFVADAGSLFLLHGVANLWLPLATTLAYAVAFVVNFGLNRQWAFAAQGAVSGQLSRYLILVVVNLVLTVVGVQGLTWLGLPYLVSKLATSALVAVINYFAFRLWVFRAPAAPAPDADAIPAPRVPAQLPAPETVGTESA